MGSLDVTVDEAKAALVEVFELVWTFVLALWELYLDLPLVWQVVIGVLVLLALAGAAEPIRVEITKSRGGRGGGGGSSGAA